MMNTNIPATFTGPIHEQCVLASLNQLPKECTVAPPGGQIDMVDVHVPVSGSGVTTTQLRFKDPEILRRHLSLVNCATWNRIIFISQKDPRSALDITVNLLQPIIDYYSITPLLLDVVSSFKRHMPRTEDGYCVPVRTSRSANALELCYLYKYAEKKPPDRTPNGQDPWEIRKTGVYHRLDLKTKQSVWIIISPKHGSLGEMRIRQCAQSNLEHDKISTNPFYIHALLISCYMVNWRQYCLGYETSLRKLFGRVMTVDLDPDFDISHETLRKINTLQHKILPLRSILTALSLVLDTLESCSHDGEEFSGTLRNLRNDLSAYTENSQYLLDFSDRIRIHTSDVLSLKNQDISVQQNDQLFKLAQTGASDSLSIRVITLLTLIYLPFSFIATLMSMCFFEMDTLSGEIIVSPQIWVFFCVSLPLAIMTVVLWRWIMFRTFPINWRKRVGTVKSTQEKEIA